MIFSITPNPALDLHGTIKKLQLNEKLYVKNETKTPGGSAINVSRILHRLNTPVITTGFLGGSTGQEFSDLLNKEKIKSSFIPIKHSTRTNVIVSNESDHQQIRLSFSGPKISLKEKTQLFQFYERQRRLDFLILGGFQISKLFRRQVRVILWWEPWQRIYLNSHKLQMGRKCYVGVLLPRPLL